LDSRDGRTQVYRFCSALVRNDPEDLLSLLSSDPVISWGPYKFKGESEIKQWISELREMFPILAIKERSMEVKGNKIKHEFLFESITKDGQQAWLPCIGIYELDEGHIRSLDIKILHGWITVKKEDLERVRPPPSAS